MGIEAKDLLLLGLGMLLSIPASMLSAWLAGPLLTMTWSYWFARLFSFALRFTAPKALRSTRWEIEWHVTSSRFAPVNRSSLQLYPFLNVVAGEWRVATLGGEVLTYRMVAIRSGSSKLTARWFDKEGDDLGYVGAMQLVIEPTRDCANGKWIGFSQDGSVKSGDAKIVRLGAERGVG